MSKPIVEVSLRSIEGGRSKARAVFDTGSYYSIIQAAKLPPRTQVLRYHKAEQFKTAAHGGRLEVTGATLLFIQVGKKVIRHEVLVSPNLSQEMRIGAGAMQAWDITIHNGGGRTRVTVGKDVRDPDVTEVD